MALVRLWLFTPRTGNYPEGGTYDTSVLDTNTGNCTDPHQEVQFQALLAYASGRGETLQKVNSAQEAFALCSAQRVVAPAATQTGTGTSTAPQQTTSIAGPTTSSSPTIAASTPVGVSGQAATVSGGTAGSCGVGGCATSVGSAGGGSGASVSPSSGQLPGTTSPSPSSGQLPGVITLPGPTQLQPLPTDSFDFVGFLKGPMGMLGIVLLILVLILHRRT